MGAGAAAGRDARHQGSARSVDGVAARPSDAGVRRHRRVSTGPALEQRCLAVVGVTDIEHLQERVLHELAEVCSAQSAALWVAGERTGLRLRAWRGLVDRAKLPDSVDAWLVQAASWSSGGAMLVPLITPAGEIQGLVQLGDSLAGQFGDELLHPTQVFGQFAATALKTAGRFSQLQRQGLRDRETGAYTLSYFTDYATKEIYKARRYGRSFSLLTFSIDNVSQLRLRLGPSAARQAQQIVLRVLSQIIRDADVVARATDQEFHVLLPETDFFGGLMFLRRALTSVADEPDARGIEAKVALGLTGGAATFPRDGDDFDELLLRCRRRMDERRGSLHHHLKLDSLSFWDELELLLGSARSPRLPEAPGEPSRRGRVADVLFDELQVEVARELLREPSSRGLVYVGGPEINATLPIVRVLDDAPPDFAPRVYALGRRSDITSHPALTPVFLEGDERLSRHEFILWLGDGAAYGLIQRRGRGATWGFHTSDPTLVEGLVSKLQTEYDLQPY
ncbi:MAG: diguanylate cyclase [Archangium sp.]|nr:diguanylate cyclase [Archangium sp.]